MNRDEIIVVLEQKFPTQVVKYVGSGTDSMAFRVGDNIVRFPHRDAGIYKTESAICNAVRNHVTVDIPNIKIADADGYTFAMHKMITGNKWSWHKFSWHPLRQRNLAKSYARFLVELHGVDIHSMRRDIPALRHVVPYCDWDEISQWLAGFMSPGQMKYFRRNYERIVGASVADDDIVFVHMGMKGANSVVDDDGNICGVFDFCGGGIYERWRDLVLPYMGRNRALCRQIWHWYGIFSGRNVPGGRIRDLAAIEFLWRRRIFPNGEFGPRGEHFIRKNLAMALARFHHLPGIMYWIIYWRMLARARLRPGHR